MDVGERVVATHDRGGRQQFLKDTVMNRKVMTSVGVALLAALICSTPASAGQHAKKKSCFWQAELVRPALTQPEKEAYIANCKANLTASPRTKPRGGY